jgi:hypothetical protein
MAELSCTAPVAPRRARLLTFLHESLASIFDAATEISLQPKATG